MIIKTVNFKKAFFQIIVSAAIFCGAGFLAYKNFIKEQENEYILAPSEKKDEEKISQFEELIKIFEKENFKKLIKFGNWPVEVKEKGRSNPFLKI